MRCRFSCKRCGRLSIIEVPLLTFVGEAREGPLYSIEVMCRRCGSHDVELDERSRKRALIGLVGWYLFDTEDVRVVRGFMSHGKETGFSEAVPFARAEAERRPDDPDALVRLANTLRNFNHHDGAVGIYERILNARPMALEAALNLGEIHFNRWRTYHIKGAKGLARRYYRTSLELLTSGRGESWAFEKDFDVGEAIATRLSQLGDADAAGGIELPASKLDPSELAKPLSELVGRDRTLVPITDMEDYAPIFFAIESTILSYWKEHPELHDRRVSAALSAIFSDPDKDPSDELGRKILGMVKANIIGNQRLGHGFEHGEVRSCILHIAGLVRAHRTREGRGYLRWARALYERAGMGQAPGGRGRAA